MEFEAEKNKTFDKDVSEEGVKEMQEYFDRDVWSQMKKEVKDMTKKESCFFAFLAGSQMMKQAEEMQHERLEGELKEMEEKMKGMSGDEIKKMLEGEDGLWENKTKVNGVWVDDETGEELEDE